MMSEPIEKNSAPRDWRVGSSEVGGEAAANGVAQQSEHGVQLSWDSPFAEKGTMEQQVDVCSEAHLQQATGEEDLAGVRNLVLTVDTNVTQVDHLGTLMPLLTELRLERGSTLASFRDLGNSLSHLRVLWLPACGVVHLDGVGALSGLEELYLAFNDVEDLTSIALHDRLEVLDLESNNIGASEQAIQLGTCSRLWSLNLIANPVCRERRYRRNIVDAVPQLASLDEEDVTDDDRRPLSAGSDGSDGQHRADSLPAFSAVACTPSRHHPVTHSSREMSPTTRAERHFRASCPVESAKSVRPTELPAPLLEWKSRRAHSSTHDVWHCGHTAAPPDVDIAGSGEEQAIPRQKDRPLSGRVGHRGKINSDLGSNCCAKVPGMKAIPAEELRNSSSRSLTYLMTEGGHDKVDGMEGGQDAEGEIFSSLALKEVGGRRSGRSPARHSELVSGKRDGGEPNRPDRPSRVFTAYPVDEEEMIGKAIKNFRLLSEMSTGGSGVSSNEHAHDGRSPWCATAQAESPSFSSADRMVTSERGARLAAVDSSLARKRRSDADMDDDGGWSPRGSGDVMDDCTAQAGVDSETRDGISLETSDVWAGKDWLLQILSLSDMRLVATSSVSQPPLQAAENAASMLTHGSEVSFAGNPALGLRHRRRPDETSNGLSPALSTTQAKLRAESRWAGIMAIVRQGKSCDAWRRSEAVERRALTRARDNGASNAGRLFEDDKATEPRSLPGERSAKSDPKMDHEQDEVEAREDEAPPTSAGRTCTLEMGCACVLPSPCFPWSSATSAVCGRRTERSGCPEEVWFLSASASSSPQLSARTHQLRRIRRNKLNAGAKGTKRASSGSLHLAHAPECFVQSPRLVDRQKRRIGLNSTDAERPKFLYGTSATDCRTSSSREAHVDVEDDMATYKACRRRRRQSEKPAELDDVPPRGHSQAFSSTRLVLKSVEVPEWSPTTATSPCRDNNNDSGNGDENGFISIVGEGGKTQNPAIGKNFIEDCRQLGRSSDKRGVPELAKGVMRQGLRSTGICGKDFDMAAM